MEIPMSEQKPIVLVVEDDPGISQQLKWCFEDLELIFAVDRASAINQLRRHEPKVVLQDLGLPPDAEGVSEGMATLTDILELAPHTKVIVITGNADTDNAVRAVGLGAYDFYQKPVDVDILKLIVGRAFRMRELEDENRRLLSSKSQTPLDGIVATSAEMLKACRIIEKVAPADIAVLILGESGTGKELLARAVHNLSPRSAEKFVAINCAAIPENLLESELFGYEKGAFTGAHKQTPGKIELASSGTLFLDEIGDMPMSLQAKMLRFLQEKVIERLGGRAEIPVDVRVVCATNQNLEKLIAEGGFREDLFYRVSEVPVLVPPLRERPGDPVVLASYFLKKHADLQGKSIRGLSQDAVIAIEQHSWPGNVRELENKIKTAVVMAEGSRVTAEDLSLSLTDTEGPENSLNLKSVRVVAETKAIVNALSAAQGNISRAAELLGISRPTLYDMMSKYGVADPTESGGGG